MAGKKAERIGTVKTAQPDAKLVLHHMECKEELGRPFEFEVELLAENDKLDLESMLGKPMTVTVKTRGNELRHFHGLASQFSFGGMHGRRVRYVAVLRPWFWFLEHRSDNRIFQDTTVPEIIKSILGDHGGDFKEELTGSYQNREYCVQYGETDFNFVSRLMEEEGIYYYFRHSASKHEMVLVDNVSSHKAFDEYANISYFPPDPKTPRLLDHISHWECMHQVGPNEVSRQSYSFKTPSTNLLGESVDKPSHAKNDGKLYEYGKLYPKAADGKSSSKLRLEEEQTGYQVLTGGGDVMGACSGHTFKLDSHPVAAQNDEYLIVGTNIQFQNNEIEGGIEGEEASFNCFFRAIPSRTAFRPARVSPKALVRGPQTAVVVGPSDDEIYTDKYGRVKIQFHWDRLGKKDDKSSCFVRVSTAVAGKNWGMIAIPRIGQEVIVDFLEGDPDQPIIVGSVYNEEQMPPYELPKNMTQSGYKSRSTKEGKAQNFNEIRFEDKKNNEEVFVHAEKNFKRVVKNNDVLQVGLATKDKGDQTIEIYNNRTVTLNEDGEEGNDTLTIGKGNRLATLELGNDTLKLKKGDRLTSLEGGHDTIQIAKGNRTVTLDNGNRTVKLGGGSDSLDVAKKITIKAGDLLEIKVGKSSLTMKKNGDISLKGKDIKISGMGSVKVKGSSGVAIDGAKVDVKANAKATVGAPMLDLKGDAMAKLKGGITMIG